MDITSAIEKIATKMASDKNTDSIDMKMLKKAMDIQANTGAQLISALPPVPANPNIGRNINTTA
ncbi:YjfB family protein [Herbaspirillum sp. RTI4]|uniref:YjfB family protein n=1 Tax=Herbaspirillum sp. RTI4 TaxID=3048640 RepID=UPI002AB40961|nr:YjfB family protein [Herbaspirillum sp. RTI4]MDY7578903.1 YjfB family protein [Herbaspirillum sp. RTI4]MEA9981992.1 YjfB family protein [Herbaspirillum sp. RTI4]